MFFGHSRIILEIYNRKRKSRKNPPFICKLNNILLNNPPGEEDITRENKSISNQMKTKPQNMSKFMGYN